MLSQTHLISDETQKEKLWTMQLDALSQAFTINILGIRGKTTGLKDCKYNHNSRIRTENDLIEIYSCIQHYDWMNSNKFSLKIWPHTWLTLCFWGWTESHLFMKTSASCCLSTEGCWVTWTIVFTTDLSPPHDLYVLAPKLAFPGIVAPLKTCPAHTRLDQVPLSCYHCSQAID